MNFAEKVEIFIQFLDSQIIAPGDLTARKQLRKQLKCKNFQWYLQHIYPESTWLKEYTDMGEVNGAQKNFANLILYKKTQ